MKKTILYLSLAFNIYAILELSCKVDLIKDCTVCMTNPDSMTLTCPCSSIDTYRYRDEGSGGGTQVTRDEAQNKLNKFHDAYPTCTMSGAFISKHALDELFCQDSTWNGIYCYMGINDDASYTMIFEGNHFKGSAIEKTDPANLQFFTAQSICPDWCGAIAPPAAH